MKILLLTDSLGLPRTNPEMCPLELTWPYLLKSEDNNIIQCSIGGATSIELFNQSKYYKVYPVDVVIIQVGIVDCVPRFVGRLEKELIKNLPYIGNKLLALLNSKYIRKIRNISYVNLAEFEKNMLSLIRNFPNTTKFYTVEIVGGKNYDEILDGVSIKIFEYNEILKSLPNSTFIQYSSNNITMSDCHHLNVNGHKVLASSLIKAINTK